MPGLLAPVVPSAPFVELGEDLGHRLAQRLLDNGARLGAGERRHAVLQLGQLLRHLGRQDVRPGGKGLAELDEHRPQLLQRQAQAFAARLLVLARLAAH
jgi:hypothetical protein